MLFRGMLPSCSVEWRINSQFEESPNLRYRYVINSLHGKDTIVSQRRETARSRLLYGGHWFRNVHINDIDDSDGNVKATKILAAEIGMESVHYCDTISR